MARGLGLEELVVDVEEWDMVVLEAGDEYTMNVWHIWEEGGAAEPGWTGDGGTNSGLGCRGGGAVLEEVLQSGLEAGIAG